jgi:hypothetical protein
MADYRASSSEIQYVARIGSKITLPNGNTKSVGRHPNAKDYETTVITKPNGQVMKATTVHKPIQEVIKQGNREEAAKKQKIDKTKAARKAQLEKKRLRTPPPKNKKK